MVDLLGATGSNRPTGGSGSDVGGKAHWDPLREVASLAKDLTDEANKLLLLEPIGQGGFGKGVSWRGAFIQKFIKKGDIRRVKQTFRPPLNHSTV